MLNELRDLARSLSTAGITTEDWHPTFKPCPKAKAFRVYLSVDGGVSRIESMDGGTGDIRKWEPNNGESFPVFNIPGIYEVADDATKNEIAGMKKRLKDNGSVSMDEIDAAIALCKSWDEKVRGNAKTKVLNSLGRTASAVKTMLGDVPKDFKAIEYLIERAGKVEFDVFINDITRLSAEGLSKGDAAFMKILFGKPVQVVLEAHGSYPYPATHRKVQAWMNERFLNKGTAAGVQTSTAALDAFGEDPSGRKEQKFPGVNLPVLGQVKLRSMVAAIPAQRRYGMIEADSFPAGEKVRMDMKSAIEWLAADERKGKTWCDLTSKTNKASLLFAYPSEMPTLPPEMAGLMGGAGEDDSDPDGRTFANIAQRVTDSLKGIAHDRPDAEIRIFVLAKMDYARTKVLTSKRYGVDHMIGSARRWQDGCAAIPIIKIRQFTKEKGKTEWAEPIVPFPAEVVWCLNTAWLRQGTLAEPVHGYTMDDALCLMLDGGYTMKHLATRAIDSIVRNSSPLILAVGEAAHKGLVLKGGKASVKQQLLLPRVLGLLLHRLDMKGGSMDSAAFLVGRYMSLADELHLKYCEGVRKGQIPPQLVGNALMATSLETPQKALAMLSQRILPYQAWAQTLRDGENVGLVRYFLRQMGEVSNQIMEIGIPKQCAEADKAQMLLGYMAWSEKADVKDNKNPEEENK